MEPKIHTYFKKLVELGGSDLHLSEGQPPKLRVHGDITPVDEHTLTHEDMVELMEPICPEKLWKAFTEGGDADFAYEMDESSRFRCNYMKQQRGYCCVFRIIPTKILTLEQLNVPEQIKRFGEMRSGLVLVTGPTGSGKSTTLAALIDYINTNFSRHIITIEDTDIVLVGEMRDLETISLALTAAETGLLVFGTLHTNNARKTVDRIIDVFPAEQQAQARTMLAGSLRGVVAQLLMKRCDKPGRVAVNEILFATPAVSAIIREGATQKLSDVIVSGKAQGMQFMDDAIWQKLQQGLVSPHEAYMKSIDKARFKNFLPLEDAAIANAGGA